MKKILRGVSLGIYLEEIIYSINNMVDYTFKIYELDIGFTTEAVPLFSQVESRKPINNPIQGRCY